MREMRREPEVPREEVPVVECLDCPARITSKELAPIHSVKSGILRALMRMARLKDSLAKGLKIIVTKVQWLC